MKKLKSIRRFFYILIIALVVILVYKGIPSLFDDDNKFSFNKKNSIEVNGDIQKENEYETPTIVIEDSDIYLNGNLLENNKDLGEELNKISNNNKKVILNSEKAKLITYDFVIDILEQNEYVIIEEK